MKSHRRLSAQQEARAERNLIAAILTLRSAEECRAFLRDLCTPAELQAMADRWAVVECLRRGLPYREVHRQTAVSITTIGRVARYLAQGNGGYALAAQRIDGAPARHPESPQRADAKGASPSARASARRAAQSGSAHG
jgi:TrpR-related protein YerC/YecD